MKNNNISESAKIYDNVQLGNNVVIEDFCIVGCPFKGMTNEKTIIGDNSVIRSHTVIYAGNKIGNNFQTGHKVNIRECNNIGNNVSIGTHSIVEHRTEIHDDVRVHSSAFIPEYSVLKKGAWVGPNAVLTNAKYPLSKNAKDTLAGPVLGENSKIGANSTILPGVNIGENSLVGAGSVVTKDVPANTIVAGQPAIKIKAIEEVAEYGEKI